jgi:hypothetical protein
MSMARYIVRRFGNGRSIKYAVWDSSTNHTIAIYTRNTSGSSATAKSKALEHAATLEGEWKVKMGVTRTW